MNTTENTVKLLKQFVEMKDLKDKEITVDLAISKSGLPCLFESGGAYTKTSEAQIISDPTGKPKTPIYVFTTGDLCNKNHAVIPITIGDLVFRAKGNREATHVSVYKVTNLDLKNKVATLSLSDCDNIDPFLAVANKSWSYHCRVPHYIKEKTNNSQVKGEKEYEQRAETEPDEE